LLFFSLLLGAISGHHQADHQAGHHEVKKPEDNEPAKEKPQQYYVEACRNKYRDQLKSDLGFEPKCSIIISQVGKATLDDLYQEFDRAHLKTIALNTSLEFTKKYKMNKMERMVLADVVLTMMKKFDEWRVKHEDLTVDKNQDDYYIAECRTMHKADLKEFFGFKHADCNNIIEKVGRAVLDQLVMTTQTVPKGRLQGRLQGSPQSRWLLAWTG